MVIKIYFQCWTVFNDSCVAELRLVSDLSSWLVLGFSSRFLHPPTEQQRLWSNFANTRYLQNLYYTFFLYPHIYHNISIMKEISSLRQWIETNHSFQRYSIFAIWSHPVHTWGPDWGFWRESNSVTYWKTLEKSNTLKKDKDECCLRNDKSIQSTIFCALRIQNKKLWSNAQHRNNLYEKKS